MEKLGRDIMKLTTKELLKKQAKEIGFDDTTQNIANDYIKKINEVACLDIEKRQNEKNGSLKEILDSDAHIEYFRSNTSYLSDIPSYDIYERKENKSCICTYTKDVLGWWGKKNKIYKDKEVVKDGDNFEQQLLNLFKIFYPTIEEDNSRKQYKKFFVLKLTNGRRFVLKEISLYSLWYCYLHKSKYKTIDDECKELENHLKKCAKKSQLSAELIKLLKKIYQDRTHDNLEGMLNIATQMRNDADRQKMLDKIKSGESDTDELQDFAEKLGCPNIYYKYTVPSRKKKGKIDDLDADLANYTTTPKAEELRKMLEPMRVRNKTEWLCGILGSLDTDELREKMIEELNSYDMSYKEIYYVAGQMAGDIYGYDIFKDFD